MDRNMNGSAGNPPYLTQLSVRELEAQITELAGHLNAANYRWLNLIAEFDRREGWSDGRLHSCAHWLNFKVGLNLGAAREKLRVAHALQKLPLIGAAMSRGELSYSKVRAMTRVAEPATEEYFLMIAHHGTAHHVETLVRHFRRCLQIEELDKESRQHKDRCFRSWYDEDGSLVFNGRLPALPGKALLKALEAALKVIPISHIDPQIAESGAHGPARRADALALVAETFLEHGPSTQNTADRFQVVVHVEAETLKNDAPGQCEIDDGPTVPAETARLLACDAGIVKVTHDKRGDILDVGRKTRSIPSSIRRALHSRDKGCRFPGCTHQRYVDAHHIRHWIHGGETKLDNLVALCRFHHRYVHERNLSVHRDQDRGWRFVRPDGSDLESVNPDSRNYSWEELARRNLERKIVIDSKTAATRWGGERMDYGIAVESLLHRTKRAESLDVSAATYLTQDNVSAETGPIAHRGVSTEACRCRTKDDVPTETYQTRHDVSAETYSAGVSVIS